MFIGFPNTWWVYKILNSEMEWFKAFNSSLEGKKKNCMQFVCCLFSRKKHTYTWNLCSKATHIYTVCKLCIHIYCHMPFLYSTDWHIIITLKKPVLGLPCMSKALLPSQAQHRKSTSKVFNVLTESMNNCVHPIFLLLFFPLNSNICHIL